LEVIGEAAKKIPDKSREKHPGIPWQEYQKKVKHFFSLFLDNTPPVRIEPVFFEDY
jgi:hypothetical protein